MFGCHNSAEQAEKQDVAWTWGNFFAAPDKASVEGLSGGRKQSLTPYRVDKIVAIRGEASLSIKPGSKGLVEPQA